MRFNTLSVPVVILLLFSGIAIAVDSDSDGFEDDIDNCPSTENGGIRGTLLDGESISYTTNDYVYPVTLTYVDPDEAKFAVNNERTPKLHVGESYALQDGRQILVTAILYQDYAGGIHSATFQIGGQLDANHNGFGDMCEPNHPPYFVTVPQVPSLLHEGDSYIFEVAVADLDNDEIQIQWILDGNVVSSTSQFTYVPSFDSVGTHHLEVKIADQDSFSFYDFLVEVQNVNRAPTFLPLENRIIEVGEIVQFRVSATDSDTDTLTYEAILPVGSSFVNQEFSWIPTADQQGEHDVTFQVSDGNITNSITIFITVQVPWEEQEYTKLTEKFERIDNKFPKLKQKYTRALKAENGAELQNYEKKLHQLEEKLGKVEDDVERLIRDVERSNENQNDLLDKLDTLREEIDTTQEDIKDILSEKLSEEQSKEVSYPTLVQEDIPNERVTTLVLEYTEILPEPVVLNKIENKPVTIKPLIFLGSGITLILGLIGFLLFTLI